MTAPTLLIIGTCDTKADELLFMKQCIREAGASALIMDVGVLGDPPFEPDFSKHDVARAAGATNAAIVALDDENAAMTRTAQGACALTRSLHADGRIHGVLMLGGTMGTDLALDVAAALPLGVPKIIVSTVAFSHLIPPDRVSPDMMMILWSGGLYGSNSMCRSALVQACGAAVGAARAVQTAQPEANRPKIAMTSLGKSFLFYMVALKPELERRGFELVVFHTTGMGGAAMEALAAKGAFAAVLDFSLQEVTNHLNGSIVASGPSRLSGAALAGIPQIVAPGAYDLVDLPTWQAVPDRFAGRPYHAHNRLIASVTTTPHERRALAVHVCEKLAQASAPTAFILPSKGVHALDREGGDLHDGAGHRIFCETMRAEMPETVLLADLDAHINDREFSDKALEILDAWIAQGHVTSEAV